MLEQVAAFVESQNVSTRLSNSPVFLGATPCAMIGRLAFFPCLVQGTSHNAKGIVR
jgi:hypothetical protein